MAAAIAGVIVNALGGAAALGTIGVALVQIGVGYIFSAVASALQKRNRKPSPGIRTKYTGQGDTSPQTIILGFYATGGHMIAPMYSHSRAPATLGDTNFGAIGSGDYATFIINLADAPITAVTALYLDGVRFELSTHLAGTAHPHYGLAVASGVDRDEWVHKVWLKVYDGTQTAADPYLVEAYGSHPDRPWKSTSWHRGGAYAIVTVKRDQKLFRSVPQFRFEIQGMEVYDPRTATTAYSENAAELIRAIKAGIDLPYGYSFGMDVDDDELPADWWDVALDTCEAQVENSGGVYENQYRAGLEIPIATPDDGGMDPLSAIDELLPAMSGVVADLGGSWIVRAGAPGLSVASFSDDDILTSQDQSFKAFQSLSETHNAVAATFPNPAAKWETTEAPPRYNAALEAEDGRRLIAKLDLDAVPFSDQVQRLMVAWAADAERRRVHVLALPPYLDKMTLLDTVTMSSEIHGYSNKTFEVKEYTPDLMSGVVRLVLREVDPDDFTPDVGDYIAQDVVSIARGPAAALSLEAFNAVAYQITDGSNNKRPALWLTWTSPSDNLEGVGWQVKRGSELVIEGATANAAAGEAILSEGILPNVQYSIEAWPIASAQEIARSGPVLVTTDDIRPSLADLGDDVADAITAAGQVSTEDLEELVDATSFATGIEPVAIVAELPDAEAAGAPSLAFLTTDQKLYRNTGTDWTVAVEAPDIIGELVAGQIAAGAIGAEQIAARAIAAKHLLISDFENLLPDGNFAAQELDHLDLINLDATFVQTTKTGPYSLRIEKPLPGNSGYVRLHEDYFVPVKGGETLFCEIEARTESGTSASGFWFRIYVYDEDKNYITYFNPAYNQSLSESWRETTVKITLPSTARYIEHVLIHNDVTSGLALIIDRYVVRRANVGQLIVDGSITAGLGIFADGIQTDDYVAGVSGAYFGSDLLEVNQLIVRNSLVDGSVSDGVSFLDLPEETYTHTETIYEAEIGGMSYEQLWHMSCTIQIRSPGSTTYNEGDPSEYTVDHGIRALFQISYDFGSGWEAYQTLGASGYHTGTTWYEALFVLHVVKNAVAARVRVYTDFDIGAFTPERTTVRNVGVSAKHVAR